MLQHYKDGSCMFVAELNGKVVGMSAVVKKEHHKPGEAELQRVSVSPAFRRQGIATNLSKKIEEFCKEQKYRRIILEATESRYAALALYKKCGFKVMQRVPWAHCINNVIMQKTL